MFLPMIFREGERAGGGGWRRNIDVREIHGLVASQACPDQGCGPNLQPKYVPLTRDQTRDPL